MAERIVVDGAKVAAMMRSPQGPVVTTLQRIGSSVQQGARLRIRPSQVRAEGGLSLRDSVVKRLLIVDGMPVMRVVGNKPYAYWLHEGTHSHEIRPKRAKALRFYSQRAGGFVFAKIVRHPGTKPNRYLTETAKLVLANYRRTGT